MRKYLYHYDTKFFKNQQQKQQLTIKLGGQLHDTWREPRKLEDDSYDPRVKVLVSLEDGNEKWFNESDVPEGSTEIKRQDIANTDFENLDEKWAMDNRIAAENAMDILFEAIAQNRDFNDEFIEEASDKIHQKWLDNPSTWSPPEQDKPYSELSEEEKDKDRAIIKKAIEIYNGAK